MQGFLSDNQINYVLFHLNLQFKITEEIRSFFVFDSQKEPGISQENKIVFKLSENGISQEAPLMIRNIPVLFSQFESIEIYRWERDSLVFNHDLLKSAFYLLSGYQEREGFISDRYNRFPYESSIQKRLGIGAIPVVNYYFEFIREGIQAFCKGKGIAFHKSSLFNTPVFILSHDVDVIDTYTFRDLVYKFKQITGLTRRRHSMTRQVSFFLNYLFQYLNVFRRKNPHWDFEYLVDAAKRRGFTSIFYFLQKDIKHQDSYYDFGEDRIRRLFQYLVKEKCEIGLHGSTRTATELHILKEQLLKLESNSGQKIAGIRQHRLIHHLMVTPELQYKAGLKYDASLGFAEAEGFRNSFCMPFKLYNFENDTMVNLWQIPLMVMDATLYMYQQYEPDVQIERVKHIIDECTKFNGLFTLLWHNGNFDVENYPGGKEFFEAILDYMKSKKPLSVTGMSCINEYVEPYIDALKHNGSLGKIDLS
jgi:hypothetical protein